MAAILSIIFVLFVLIGRVILQIHQTGNHGIRFANPSTDPIAAMAGSSFLLSFALSLLVIAVDFVGIRPLERWNSIVYFREITLTVGMIGIVIIITAQWQMRDAWRIGVAPNEKTALITQGLYKKSRNPIYFGIFLYWVGIAGTLAHPIIWCLALVCWISIEIIVRKVEEPHLSVLHGSDYDRYREYTNRYWIF